MHEELRRCNSIGKPESAFLFYTIIDEYGPVKENRASELCTLNHAMNISPKIALQFYDELKIVENIDGSYQLTGKGKSLRNKDYPLFLEELSVIIIDYLFINEFIAHDAVSYDIATNKCRIKSSGISFVAAIFRNFLIDVGTLIQIDRTSFEISHYHEKIFEEKIKLSRSKMSLERLLDLHKQQEIQGRLAEEFVVEYEKRRLKWCANSEQIRQISDIDVAAGFDILSFECTASIKYDRFIEVKSFSNSKSFFWSANERKIAKQLTDSYYIYLVDMNEISMDGYSPIIIKNPIQNVLNSDEWIIETDSIKVMGV